MERNTPYIAWFSDVSCTDVALVGGKNASLAKMIQHLSQTGIQVPVGFAITTAGYNAFLDQAGIRRQMSELLSDLNPDNLDQLTRCGQQIRAAILGADFPSELMSQISKAYARLSSQAAVTALDVAVRSSATLEDLPTASFAGQQDTYLNVYGQESLVAAVQSCFASLFTDRAISYRHNNGFDHTAVAMSVGVQRMVRADSGAAGVLFTIDPESGFRDAVVINATWGLGELLVQGQVEPDEYTVFKPTLLSGVTPGKAGSTAFTHRPIIAKRLGSKQTKLIYADTGTTVVAVDSANQQRFVLTDDDILTLAYWGSLIEQYYGGIPMDIEWCKDGQTGQLFVLQARPETVQSQTDQQVIEEYILENPGNVLLRGVAVGRRVGSGPVTLITDPSHLDQFSPGDVLVTDSTDPDWEPIMKQASGIITNSGGRTSHAAIVARELGIPAVVGARTATTVLQPGQVVTVSCAEGETGLVYAGAVPFQVETTNVDTFPTPPIAMMLIAADTSRVFQLAQLPHSGVGLARQELIILNSIQIHPLALARFDELTDPAERAAIEQLTAAYSSKPDFYVETLAQGVGKIAAAFYPKPVIVRLSDFRSNEYASLLGGRQFEPHEENPMIGWRGASRYYSPDYAAAFALECQALLRVRRDMGLTNVKLMVPFCRTPEEGRRVLDLMATHGLEQGVDGLEVYVMCELPSNVLLAAEFAELFDGFSIGSNDLTQLILGLDRDSALVADLYDERNPAVKAMIAQAISAAHAAGIPVGICGQGPSDFPDFAEFLVDQGIDSIALNPDSLLKTSLHLANYKSGNSA